MIAHSHVRSQLHIRGCRQRIDGGVSYAMIHFVPVPGASSPASLRLRGKTIRFPCLARLWIEPQSGAIVKLEANRGGVPVGHANQSSLGPRQHVPWTAHGTCAGIEYALRWI